MASTVTFDTNVFERFLNPGGGISDVHSTVLGAIKSGRVKGYFSDTFVTLEGVKKGSRRSIFGSRKIASSSSMSPDNANTIILKVGARMDSISLDARHIASVKKLLKLGILGMRGQAYLGDSFNATSVLGFDIYEPLPLERIINIREVMAATEKSMAIRFTQTGIAVGKCKARELGLRLLSEREEGAREAMWYEGFGLASASKNKVEAAVAEWADGDSIISHIGHGHDFFCTSDEGKSGAGPSILDAEHRAWLSAEHNVRFVSPEGLLNELAQQQSI